MTNARILIVDERSADRKVMKNWLLFQGNVVEVAHGGKQAIGLIHDNQYGLVILNLELDDVDGLMVFQKIVADPYVDRNGNPIIPPCILSTSSMNPKLLEMVARAGFADVLGKPLDRNLLLQAVERVLREREQQNKHPDTAEEEGRYKKD